MKYSQKEKAILDEVIIAYRRIIEERYQYEAIQNKYQIPDTFDKARVDLFRAYFLDQMYPDPQKREELNEAFESLDNYIRQPGKLLRILIESGRLIFKYGRHLPKILGAGIKALKSFRKAMAFEHSLVRHAISENMESPFSKDDIFDMMRSLSREEIDDFIDSTYSLFETLYDRELVGRIIEIVEHLIKMMVKRPRLYSRAEVRGMEIGHEVVHKGNELFDQLNETDQRRIFTVIIALERGILDQIFEKE